MATYEGQHNHDVNAIPPAGQSLASSATATASTTTSSFPYPVLDNPFRPTITLDLTLSGSDKQNCSNSPSTTVLHDQSTSCCEDDDNKRIEDYVSSLTKDPNFTVALAAAVARSIYERPIPSTP